MAHFIVTYEHRSGRSVVTRYENALEAFDEFSRRERELIGDDEIEVVLLAAEREEDLRLTHPNFFGSGDMLPA